jgi:glycosyltransferase involved in cell wall biosynthesis
VRIVVVLDGCTDGTRALAEATSGVETVQVWHRMVGRARRAGAEHALAGRDAGSVWLASTDADSAVPGDWMTSMLDCAAAGADLVLGTVQLDARTPAERVRAWQSGYRPTADHRHIHGANLGIRGDAYRRLNGWPHLASGEDVMLARRAEAAGLRILRVATMPVVTSGRTAARAPNGFGAYLAGLREAADQFVE